MNNETYSMTSDIVGILDLLNPSFNKSISEAVVNAFHADAKNIILNIGYFKGTTNIDYIEIVDDGCGFTQQNRESFFKTHSTHKKDIGGKGLGRFTWLKFFKHVDISSTFNEGGKFVNVQFKFSEEHCKKSRLNIRVTSDTQNKTCIKLSCYYQQNTLHNHLENSLKKFILKEMFMMLYAMRNSFKIAINFYDGENKIDTQYIDINDVSEIIYDNPFEMLINDKNYSFRLKAIENEASQRNKITTCLISHGRSLSNFKDAFGLKVNAPSENVNKEIFLFLESEFLNINKYISSDRESFLFPDTMLDENTSLKQKLCSEISNQVNIFFDSKYPDTKKQKEFILSQIFELYPHYREEQFSDIINLELSKNLGKLKRNDLLKKLHEAEYKRIDAFKINYTKFLKNKNLSSATVDKIADLAKRTTEQAKSSLSNYFWFRKAIIEQLDILIEDNEKSEELLHRLFYKQRDTSQKFDLQNCIWLLDDKFMNFSYFASDIEIKKILLDIYGEHEYDGNSKKRPDLFMIFNAADDENIKDCVIIEFKALGTTADEKANAASQVRRKYVQSVRKHTKNVRYVFVYIITDIDDQLAADLTYDEFTLAMTRYGNILVSYAKKGDAYICFLCAKAIIGDAKDRHELFFKLLKEELETRAELK